MSKIKESHVVYWLTSLEMELVTRVQILVKLFSFHIALISERRCLRGVMVKAMDCGIVVSEFELQSRYYVHFQTNVLGKGRNLHILPAMG